MEGDYVPFPSILCEPKMNHLFKIFIFLFIYFDEYIIYFYLILQGIPWNNIKSYNKFIWNTLVTNTILFT